MKIREILMLKSWLMIVGNMWWEPVIKILKFLSLSALPNPFIEAVITVGMVMRGKTDSLFKKVLVPESIRAVYSRWKINKPPYVSLKHDNLIT